MKMAPKQKLEIRETIEVCKGFDSQKPKTFVVTSCCKCNGGIEMPSTSGLKHKLEVWCCETKGDIAGHP
jgi:hypothetical protein